MDFQSTDTIDLLRRFIGGVALACAAHPIAAAPPATPATPTSQARPAAQATSTPSAAPAPVAAGPSAAGAGDALGCLVKPSQVVELGSPAVGIIDQLHIGRGDAVKAQQRIATLRDGVERAAVGVAHSRASAEAELEGAARGLDIARRKLERTQDLARTGFVSPQAVDLALAERQAAESRHALAAETLQQARRELQLASAQLDNRIVRSPISGVVVDVYRQPGERVEDKPIAKIATLDPLHVEVVLPAAYFGQVRRGDALGIQPLLPGVPVAAATVEVVDPIVDAGSNTLRVRLVLPNPDARIPAGVRCRATLKPTAPGAELSAEEASRRRSDVLLARRERAAEPAAASPAEPDRNVQRR